MLSLIQDDDDLDRVILDLRKRDHEEKDPSARSNQGKRKRSSGKDSKPSKTSLASKETSKGNTLPKSSKTKKSASAKESVKEATHEVTMGEEEPVQENVNDADQPQDDPKGDRCPFDLSKPFPLKGHLGHLTIASEYFFNNDLEYLKSLDPEKKYTTSIKEKKSERFSKHDVYSHLKIMSVVSMKVNKLHGYGYLEEIVVRRADRQKYNFKEGDFINLHLNDIEDMLFLVVQHKLFHLDDMPRIKWSDSDKRRSVIMVDLINKQILERRILKNLERLFGARELEMDYRLMQRTI
nr:hypothetical protein [Tanacetum cinerariifolium]